MFRRESSLGGVIAVNTLQRLENETNVLLNNHTFYLNNLFAENIPSYNNIQLLTQHRYNNLAIIKKRNCMDTKYRIENDYNQFMNYLEQINTLMEALNILNTKLKASKGQAPSVIEFLQPLEQHVSKIYLNIANAIAVVLARSKLNNESMDTINLLKESVQVADLIYSNPYFPNNLKAIDAITEKLHAASKNILCPHARALTKKIALTFVCASLAITGILVAASLVLSALPLCSAAVFGVAIATLLTTVLAARDLSVAYSAGYCFWNKATSNSLKPIEKELTVAHENIDGLQKAFPMKKGA